MKPLKSPGAQDVARLLRPTTGEIVGALEGYYSEIGRFSYDPARRVARAVFGGEITLEAARQSCLSRGHPGGRASNAEVAELIWAEGQDRVKPGMCFDLHKRDFMIRSDVSISVKPLFYFVEDRKPKIYWLQPRRGYALNVEQMGILAAIIRLTYIRDDFENADLELFDVSVPAGTKVRAPRTYTLADLPHLSDHHIQSALQRFAEALDILRRSGFQPPARPPRPTPPNPQTDLF